ncbi:phage tail assembly chaperone [Paracoccus onubensis]|uniref:phage tail assembly chaperone n=1 Tax=Paracoccus onubensis TaxID=1675788 RepID=UPI002730E572|nr:phage tail assembly chaperone [Paracoccus onubensis]MDP0928244.1 phage tail assembly chaperone [Paracoccus onubensis]
MSRRLDWAGMMRAGMRGLGLRPDQFWMLTPFELALMLGVETRGGEMTRARLEELAERYGEGKGALPPRS